LRRRYGQPRPRGSLHDAQHRRRRAPRSDTHRDINQSFTNEIRKEVNLRASPYSYGLAAQAGPIYNDIACSGGRAFVGHDERYHWRLTRPGLLGTPGLVCLRAERATRNPCGTVAFRISDAHVAAGKDVSQVAVWPLGRRCELIIDFYWQLYIMPSPPLIAVPGTQPMPLRAA
jgi:hypothetical protein